MTCERDFPDDVVAAYASGRLDEAVAAAFEDHYFGCPECLERLRLLQDLPAALSAAPRDRAGSALRRSGPGGKAWTWLAAAASLLLAVGVWRGLPREPSAGSPGPGRPSPVATPAPDPLDRLRELGRFEPPAWAPETLRGTGAAPAGLEQGLRHYLRRDYAAAVRELGRAASGAPRDPGVRFFLGAALLLDGQLEAGAAELQRTVALGDTPYLEEAHLLLARAWLARGEAAAATRELEAVLRLQGDHEDEARALRRSIDAAVSAGGP